MDDCISKVETLEAIKALPADLDAEATQRAIEAVSAIPATEVIPLGVEMWSDRFEIKRRWWRSEDGEHMAESFMIVRKEDNK